MSCSLCQDTSATSGSAVSAKSSPPVPAPSVNISSSTTCVRPRVAAAARSARSLGCASREARRSKRAKAAPSASTGGMKLATSSASPSASAASSASSPGQRAASSAAKAAHSAHSLTSVAVKSASIGAASASEAPPACTRAARARCAAAAVSARSHPRCARARAARTRQASSRASFTAMPVVSSCAPVPAKNRLAPVRRREASKGSTMASSVFGLGCEAHAALIADEALEIEGERLARPRTAVRSGLNDRRRRWRDGLQCRSTRGLELDDLLPGAHQRVGENEQQVAGLSHLQCSVDCLLLIRNDRDRSARDPCLLESRRLEAWDLIGLALAQVVVAAADVVIESPGNRLGDGDEILIAAVAGTGEHHDTPPGHLQALSELGHGRNGVGVVPIVEQHLEGVFIEDVHPSWRLEEGRIKGSQTLADRVQLDPERESHGGGEHRILHVVGGAALERRGNQVRPQQWNVS